VNSILKLERAPEGRILRLIPKDAMRRFSVLPLAVNEESRELSLAMVDTEDFELISDIQAATGLFVKPAKATQEKIDEWIDAFTEGEGSAATFNVQNSSKSLSPATRLVNELLSEAMHSGVSDIHFEPGERDFIVRFRKDGVLSIMRKLPVRTISETISRIKIMAKMDIAEHRRPQDGRIHFNDGSREVDVRVSALPTDYGQKMVLRLLDRGTIIHELGSLGMQPRHIALAKKEIHKPYGMFLITGPTGSGKTTTLYTLLQMVRSPELNISTIEEPIEYKIPGIIQTAVNSKIGLTFANVLRTLLRQDPDVIMVGEIRDRETAELAIQAALTGHLVFSTLHTNDAPSAIVRLVDMGIEPFLVASALNFVMAQRLVRRICPKCGGHDSANCVHCGGLGYRGRLGLYEMMPVSESIRELIHSKAPLAEVRKKAKEEGMTSLLEDGRKKVTLGLTTESEIASEAMT